MSAVGRAEDLKVRARRRVDLEEVLEGARVGLWEVLEGVRVELGSGEENDEEKRRRGCAESAVVPMVWPAIVMVVVRAWLHAAGETARLSAAATTGVLLALLLYWLNVQLRWSALLVGALREI